MIRCPIGGATHWTRQKQHRDMKRIVSRIVPALSVFAFLAVALMTFPSFAAYTLEDISPHFSADMPIVWQAPTNQLPKHFWIYEKSPHVFSATTISNAIVLASFQGKGFPKPSKDRIVLWANRMDGEPMPPYFEIEPDEGRISFSLGDRAPDSPDKIWTNQATIERAWNCLAQLGVDQTQFVKTNAAGSGAWGIFLPRLIDGIKVYDQSEGFSFQQFGKDGKIREFGLMLPVLQREIEGQTATPLQIIASIREFKTPSLPDGDEPDYFGRIKHLAKARKLTITGITPYYGEGIYGEMPTNGEPSKIATPIAQLEAIADFGSSNATVKLFVPILASEANRLLRPEQKH
jgi:hypothetical protein